MDLMSSKRFKLNIDRPTHEKSWILDLVFLPSDYVIGNAKIFGPDSYVDIADHFLKVKEANKIVNNKHCCYYRKKYIV